MDEPAERGGSEEVGSIWYLEGLFEGSRRLRRFPINAYPYRIGRHPEVDLTIPSDSVSQEHAEIVEIGGLLRVRDLDSTNGTFVNGTQVGGTVILIEGDILQIADVEFVVGRSLQNEIDDHIGRTTEVNLNLATSRVSQVLTLRGRSHHPFRLGTGELQVDVSQHPPGRGPSRLSEVRSQSDPGNRSAPVEAEDDHQPRRPKRPRSAVSSDSAGARATIWAGRFRSTISVPAGTTDRSSGHRETDGLSRRRRCKRYVQV